MNQITRILRPKNGAAPGMPKAKGKDRKRKIDALDQHLAVTSRNPELVAVLPRITLPWPAAELWPNRQKGRSWRYSYAAKRAQVKATADACIKAGYHLLTVAPGPIRVVFVACPPSNGRRDDDNIGGALKAARDTISRALGVDDGRFEARVIRGDRSKDGGVIVDMEVERHA